MIRLRRLSCLASYLGTFEGGATQEQSENNLFEAIDSIGEEDLNDLPEVQHSAEGDSDMVED